NISEKIAELIDKATPIVEKLEFDCFKNEKFTKMIYSFPSRKYVVIVGVEAHICLFQTILGAIKNDYIPIIVSDAVSSRKESDYQTALNCYKSLDILIFSTEMLIYFLLKKAGTQKFKHLLQYLK
ncbi:MAG: isochorismatase family protein, partial [Candidatus Heimdallarchaeota archaeon]|nr:isochorismatase family protein [Candidatus Heimdallarchaeota archaeon]